MKNLFEHLLGYATTSVLFLYMMGSFQQPADGRGPPSYT